MASFQPRFDESAAEARRVVAERSSEIREILTNFSGTDFDRLSKSISALLEKVDKDNVDHPEYLSHSSGSIAEHSITLIGSVPSSLESGPSHFVQTTLPALILCEERLQKAVGHYYYQVREVKGRQVREIQKLAEEAVEFREDTRENDEAVKEIRAKAEELLAELETLKANASAASQSIGDTRNYVSKLAAGDGRGKSLEALKRTAESKVDSIDGVIRKSATAAEKAETSSKAAEDAATKIQDTKAEIDAIKIEAEGVLALSHQAGLARSYLKESKKLEIRSYIYTFILYVTAVATALIAAIYVLPSLELSITANGGTLSERALPLALLRATILAPLVFIIYFTNRQISSLETLRMDYAEKAAASLAYSGYKDEMSVDTALLDRLRGSLLMKFAEHPERLLRKRPVRDTIEVEGPGFKASSVSAEAGSGKTSGDKTDS